MLLPRTRCRLDGQHGRGGSLVERAVGLVWCVAARSRIAPADQLGFGEEGLKVQAASVLEIVCLEDQFEVEMQSSMMAWKRREILRRRSRNVYAAGRQHTRAGRLHVDAGFGDRLTDVPERST